MELPQESSSKETTSNAVSDDELSELWKDQNFEGKGCIEHCCVSKVLRSSYIVIGAFAGVKVFKRCLALYRNIHVPETRIRRVLNSIHSYVTGVVTPQRGRYAPRRSYDIRSRKGKNKLGNGWQ